MMQVFRPPRPRPPRPCPSYPCPAPQQGYLMQKLIACERRTLSNLCAEWCFEDCCRHSIQSVSPGGSPVWTLENGCTLHISLPVCVQLCDGCGCFTRTAMLNLETELPQHFLCSMNDPRATLLILPCIRLLHADCACNGCYRAQLQVTLEICLVRYETLPCGSCKPECPQLPLYPPPIC